MRAPQNTRRSCQTTVWHSKISCTRRYFLNRNARLLDTVGQPVINDIGLAALALLVAESDPARKDTLIRLIMNMLATPP